MNLVNTMKSLLKINALEMASTTLLFIKDKFIYQRNSFHKTTVELVIFFLPYLLEEKVDRAP